MKTGLSAGSKHNSCLRSTLDGCIFGISLNNILMYMTILYHAVILIKTGQKVKCEFFFQQHIGKPSPCCIKNALSCLTLNVLLKPH